MKASFSKIPIISIYWKCFALKSWRKSRNIDIFFFLSPFLLPRILCPPRQFFIWYFIYLLFKCYPFPNPTPQKNLSYPPFSCSSMRECPNNLQNPSSLSSHSPTLRHRAFTVVDTFGICWTQDSILSALLCCRL